MNTPFDPLGETEPNDIVYTINAYCPPRPPPGWIPKIFTGERIDHKNRTYESFRIRPEQTGPNYDCFEGKDLDDMGVKTIKIKSFHFPADIRCEHVQNSKTCNEICYVLERSGDRLVRWRCKSESCEGHVYCGTVKEYGNEFACFGNKGKRLVAIPQAKKK
ncbi:hypothetical protein BS50DRAFT_627578 [Corynespora cassiicola Philippines]|uniref:Uncharacterized protein n=1 Tax=Corynespora cassiicola Philippines TaxID=1448308 RepID=A0A2T2P9A0_CORCC|nr:hypothetical protein BS50DRAFT_627578 [Corynespora cassiicola Philippines]